MNIKELRIGNTIWHNTLGYSIITELRTDGISIADKNNTGHSIFINNPFLLKPIDLTIEIIINLGFKKIESIGCKPDIDYYVYIPAGFSLQKPIGDDIIVYKRYAKPSIELFYLHNLQNLYFTLMGEELEVKL